MNLKAPVETRAKRIEGKIAIRVDASIFAIQMCVIAKSLSQTQFAASAALTIELIDNPIINPSGSKYIFINLEGL